MPSNPYEPSRAETGPPRRPRRYFAVYIALGFAGAIVGFFGTALMAAIDDVNTLPHIAFATLAPMVWYRLFGGGTNGAYNPAMRPGFLSKGRIVHSVRYTFSEGSDLSVPLTPDGDAADGSITPEDPAKRVVSLRPGDFALVGGYRCQVESVTVGDWIPARSHTAWSLEEDGRTAWGFLCETCLQYHWHDPHEGPHKAPCSDTSHQDYAAEYRLQLVGATTREQAAAFLGERLRIGPFFPGMSAGNAARSR